MASFPIFTSYVVWSLVTALAFTCFNLQEAEAARAFFVFGDSLVDNGNNNYLVTTARADAPPYGIDYPTHTPTGRFSNGRNIPDFISSLHNLSNSYFTILNFISTVVDLWLNFAGEALGSEPTLPYLSPELDGEKLLVGANFASAGIGVLVDTGVQFVCELYI